MNGFSLNGFQSWATGKGGTDIRHPNNKPALIGAGKRSRFLPRLHGPRGSAARKGLSLLTGPLKSDPPSVICGVAGLLSRDWIPAQSLARETGACGLATAFLPFRVGARAWCVLAAVVRPASSRSPITGPEKTRASPSYPANCGHS